MPVKVLAALAEDEIEEFISELRNLQILIGEETAVDVGERGKVGGEIGIALVWRRVQDAEEGDERVTRPRGGKLR